MDVKNTKSYIVSANSYKDILIDTETSGWTAVVHWHFNGDVTGQVGMQVERNGSVQNIAVKTVTAEADAIWQGNCFVNVSDYITLQNQCAAEAEVFIVYGYELAGTGTWQTFSSGEVDESSSSSSQSSESSETSSESSESSELYSESTSSSGV